MTEAIDQLDILDEVDALITIISFEDHTILYGNRKIREVHGSDVVGKKCWEVLQSRTEGPCDFCGNIWTHRHSKAGDTHCWVEEIAGTGRFYEHHEKLVRWRGNVLARLMISSDVTQRLQYEKALEESEGRYRVMFSRARSVMLLIDPASGEIVDANRAAGEFYGYEVETLRTMTIMDINTLTGEEIHAEMEKARNEERGHFKFRHKLANGDIRDVEVYSGPVTIHGRDLLYSLVHDISERMELERELLFRANHDSLTGILNRRSFMERADEEVSRAARYQTPFGLILLDLDHFKIINDTYGHQAGDKVLTAVASAISGNLRDTDFCGRLGGEEFGVGLLHTSPKEAELCAERIRKAVAEQVVKTSSFSIETTLSAGVTCHHPVDDDIDDLFRRADAALYRAKTEGRNKVVTLIL